MANAVSGAIKIAFLCVLVIMGLAGGVLSILVPAKYYLKIAKAWHFLVTLILGVRCDFKGADFVPGALLVSNHISWLDVSVLGSKLPIVFLAKSEIEKWPLLGFMIKKAGTLFIKRGEGSHQAIKLISESLVDKQSVLIFPEGKTTDGLSVARFHPRLMQSAIDVNANVQPIGLSYWNKQGNRAPEVSYCGTTTFLQSLWRVACQRGVWAEVRIFNPLELSANRDDLARESGLRIKCWLDA